MHPFSSCPFPLSPSLPLSLSLFPLAVSFYQVIFSDHVNTSSVLGLVLTLYIEQHEYISALTPSAGVRVLVHLQSVQPFPEDSEGIDVMPGRKTSVSVRKVTVSRRNS